VDSRNFVISSGNIQKSSVKLFGIDIAFTGKAFVFTFAFFAIAFTIIFSISRQYLITDSGDATTGASGVATGVSTSIPPTTSSIPTRKRVWLLAGKDAQKKMFDKFKSELEAMGFTVPVARILNDDTRPSEPEIRYYNKADRQEAEIIMKFVRSKLSDKTIQANYYSDPSATGGYIEIWFGR
jgi:hypothetical protein